MEKSLPIPEHRPFTLALEDFIKGYQNQALLAAINQAYEDQPDPDEQERLAKMRAQQRKLVEGEW